MPRIRIYLIERRPERGGGPPALVYGNLGHAEIKLKELDPERYMLTPHAISVASTATRRRKKRGLPSKADRPDVAMPIED